MGRANQATAIPAGDRTRKACGALQSRLSDVVAHDSATAVLYRRSSAQLLDVIAPQDYRASSLWKIGTYWAVVAVDQFSTAVNVFTQEGPARDKHHRTAAYLAAKAPRIQLATTKRGTSRRGAQQPAGETGTRS